MTGSAVWIAQCACVLLVTPALLSSGVVNPSLTGLIAAVIASLGAIVTGMLGSFLLSAAAFRLGSVVWDVLGVPNLAEAVRQSLFRASRRSQYAGLSFAAYGVLAVVAIVGVAFVASGPTRDPGQLIWGLLLLAFLDVAASFVLLHAATHLSNALRQLRRDFAWDPRPLPPDLRGFAYLNVAGTLALAVGLPFVVGSPMSPTGALCFLAPGAILGGVVAPLYGLAGFLGLARFGRTLT